MLPNPQTGESKDVFLKRSMADAEMVTAFTDDKHRYAESLSLWDRANPVPRKLDFDASEMRLADDDGRRLTGYAAKYNSQTDLGWFKEKIKSGAFDDAIATDDVRALKNHDPNLLLGRTASGTLRLTTNTVGLQFDIDVPDTTTGRDTLEEVRRGDLRGCSFSFTIAEDKWTHFDDGRPSERVLVRIGRLFDVGPVTFPAYESTSVAVRSLEQFRQEVKPTEADLPPADETHAAADAGEPAEPEPAEISAERQREIGYEFEEMGRLIRHVEKVNAASP